MKKVTRGLIIAACGVVALSGGVTLALWNGAQTVNAGVITSGDFGIKQLGATKWMDTSTDVPGNPRSIDPAAFRFTPGDTIAMEQAVAVTADGDNLHAKLTVTVPALTGALAAPGGVSADFTVLDSNGNAVPGGTNLALGDPASIPIVKSGTYSVKVDFTFDPSAADQSATIDAATLGAVDFHLEQVRP